ncbi:cupin domain-containing protein [Salinilacihabitans rarus]|uniref:cupin domain-containing protein n=1 Tax=Salinilacihabitans rarus TaxID=2961596 RepID=UPI0020C86B7D|nr:cupin domain-containing protein [Salinilacihabitans rarus]
MRKVSISDVDPDPYDDDLHADRRALTGPLNAADLAIVRYALDPGERFSGSLHAHADQEEVFVVLEGEATFETRASDEDETREVVVGENEAIRFAPGEFQTGRNDGDGRVVALALGAPRDSEDVRIARIPALDGRDVSCPDCGREAMRLSRGDADFVCPDCGGTLDVE